MIASRSATRALRAARGRTFGAGAAESSPFFAMAFFRI
jgi:hypothetical protein